MKRKNVLIIDDDQDIIELLEFNLSQIGFGVQTANSGLQGIWNINDEELPDTILLDLKMPSPDGKEVLKCLKATDGWRKIPVIVISAKSSENEISQCMNLGANAYLTKPFSMYELVSLVTKMT